MRIVVPLFGLALLAGCSTNPITGRDQIVVLPELQAAYADIGFALSAGSQSGASSIRCKKSCGSDAAVEEFAVRVETIAAQLDLSARAMSPELFERIGKFRVEVNGGLGAGSGSSAGGRVALGSGLADLEPTDTVIAFLLAREMAHVIARHDEENSGVSMAFSALGMLLPGINVLARFVATTLGSGMLKSSWAAQQRQEADEIAISLLERSSIAAHSVALELETGINRARVPDDEWGARYFESTERVAVIAATPPRYATFGD